MKVKVNIEISSTPTRIPFLFVMFVGHLLYAPLLAEGFRVPDEEVTTEVLRAAVKYAKEWEMACVLDVLESVLLASVGSMERDA